MKYQITFIILLLFCLLLTHQLSAQLNFTQTEGHSKIHLKDSNSIFHRPIRSQYNLSNSLTLLEKDAKNVDQFLEFETNAFNQDLFYKQIFHNNNHQYMDLNRRLKYSSLWAFTSLNYLYADLVGLMDLNLLNQYQTGVVNGIEITPGFLTAAAAYMQIPLSNVFLPHVIKNDKVLRWVQIISGSIATIAQSATLFVGKPTPYYVLFSAIEIGATAYITIDAIKWKVGKKQKVKPKNFY